MIIEYVFLALVLKFSVETIVNWDGILINEIKLMHTVHAQTDMSCSMDNNTSACMQCLLRTSTLNYPVRGHTQIWENPLLIRIVIQGVGLN